jgi:excisionase family DNA binding protein
MRGTNLAAILAGLRDEDPEKFVSLVRLVWPDIKAALGRGHTVKVIHERFVKGGVDISYRLFALYVGQLRREDVQRNLGSPSKISNFQAHVHGDLSGSPRNGGKDPFGLGTGRNRDDRVALARVPKRRLFSAKAAAQYLGIHEQTLRKITDKGFLPASRLGVRRVYKLEDLDSYIESLPSCITVSRI